MRSQAVAATPRSGGVGVGRPPGWTEAATGLAGMRSPRRPTAARLENHRDAIARGLTSEDAAVEARVSQAVGTRWFRDFDGMPPSDFPAHASRRPSFAEREEIDQPVCRRTTSRAGSQQGQLAGTSQPRLIDRPAHPHHTS